MGRRFANAWVGAILSLMLLCFGGTSATAKEPTSPSPPASRKQLTKQVEEIAKIHAQVRDLVRSARTEKDLVKLNALTEVYTQIKTMERIAIDSLVAWYEKAAEGDSEGQMYNQKRIEYTLRKSKELRVRADQAIGSSKTYTGTTVIGVESDKPPFFTDPTPVEPPPTVPPSGMGMEMPPWMRSR